MNTLHIIGNLTADPAQRTVNTQKGALTVCDFTVAVNRYVGGQKTTDYIKVTLWEKAALNACKYLAKGRKVAVTGAVGARAWTDEYGKARATLEIRRVEEIEYLSARPDGQTPDANEDENSFAEVKDDDLPF